MQPIFIPSGGPEGWKAFLADPSHWRTGFSARSLASSWEAADGFPAEVESVLARTAQFAQPQLLLALPEHKVMLPGGSRASQTDLFALVRTPASLAAMAVEGKVSESFDRTIGEWFVDPSPGKQTRRD